MSTAGERIVRSRSTKESCATMKAILYSCGALLLSVAMLPRPAQAQAAAGPNTDVAQSTASQIQQLRETLAAQQRQIAEQQAKIDALAKQLEAQQPPHAPNLGEVASTTAMVPAGTATASEVSLPASLAQDSGKPSAGAAPPASDSIVLAGGKIKLGAVAYADWSYYPSTGYGPVFLDTPHTYPGPGNDGFNAFNLNRAYVNIVYAPTDWLSFRVTPDIYRDINSAAGQKIDGSSGWGATTNGSLNLRLKYGYAEFGKMFSGAFKDDTIRFGQTTNPMIDWQESLYGYRFVSLVPWNFISLSSTYQGVSLNGPIKGSNGKQYVDYQLGVFNNSNFHGYELAENKTVMARVSVYPMGASSKYQGLGLTGFIDYGYNNKVPSAASLPVVRGSALVHYQSAHNGAQIAFEYMFGRNAFSSGNLFGGAAPLDLIGLAASGSPANPVTTAVKAVLAGNSVKQQGFDFFGHVNLGKSPWALFGMYQYFQPNKDYSNDPFDFDRVVAGVSYKVNKNLRFAFDNQDVLYRRNGALTSAELPDIKALFLNMEFSF